MKKAIAYDRKEGLDDRAIYEKYVLAQVQYLGGSVGVRIVDGRVVFAELGTK